MKLSTIETFPATYYSFAELRGGEMYAENVDSVIEY